MLVLTSVCVFLTIFFQSFDHHFKRATGGHMLDLTMRIKFFPQTCFFLYPKDWQMAVLIPTHVFQVRFSTCRWQDQKNMLVSRCLNI